MERVKQTTDKTDPVIVSEAQVDTNIELNNEPAAAEVINQASTSISENNNRQHNNNNKIF